MNLTKKITRKIYRKLSFTNGWSIDDTNYYKLCHEVAEDIIKTIKEETSHK